MTIASCRTTVALRTDGSLTERAVVMITPDYNGMTGKAHTPIKPQAFRARPGCKGIVKFKVSRAQAKDACVAILVPDYAVEGNELELRFVPALTKQIIFSQNGITPLLRRTAKKKTKETPRRNEALDYTLLNVI